MTEAVFLRVVCVILPVLKECQNSSFSEVTLFPSTMKSKSICLLLLPCSYLSEFKCICFGFPELIESKKQVVCSVGSGFPFPYTFIAYSFFLKSAGNTTVHRVVH